MGQLHYDTPSMRGGTGGEVKSKLLNNIRIVCLCESRAKGGGRSNLYGAGVQVGLLRRFAPRNDSTLLHISFPEHQKRFY
jgi:hypothetical protein